ncbi:DUF5682 family protein [Actinomadura rudentiformis]|uniref:ChaN family lipoprotein n=1 Tax=Actinomadura rudentiformis TaxID=359158 RepID=A0A6H9YP11_9ACTN|nr:DUF5682 family protein [Actinomadura rudentiformis]KAB2344405.1 hypothetical protein F8566_31220 [Actinomadura rudentiformis]
MTVTFVGVRHHSPACARLVRRTIERLRPAYVLIEGPADFSERLDELALGHELPVAIFSHYRDGDRSHLSWTPFCDYSPEWVALTSGRAAGADVRFIDLPAWHPAFADRRNRYADAEQRYAKVMERLCHRFAVDNVDALWDHMVEVEPDDRLEERLATYFDLIRGESGAGEDDSAREAYMARWIRAAVSKAGEPPVVVVTGGFHRPALQAMVDNGKAADGDGWPEVPSPPDGASGGSYLVPYSFRRLDSFTGYQSGMPSPEYYQRLWESGAKGAAEGLIEAVVSRLRKRKQAVSTADLIAARTLTDGLARLRGHSRPSRTDLLDGLVAALVSDDLEEPLPWTSRGPLSPRAHPVVAEMVAALSGGRVGRLHPETPAPPLVHDVTAELERLRLDRDGTVTLKLTEPRDLARSRALHRLRVLRIPGAERDSGPSTGVDPVLREQWTLSHDDDTRLSALIEAGAYGATLADAATAVLEERTLAAGPDVGLLGDVLFDAALCGATELSDTIGEAIAAGITGAADVAALGRVLATVLGLWRHDRLLGTARSPLFGTVIEGCVTRLLWLVEGVRGGPAPADLDRLAALAATRDALIHAGGALGLDRRSALGVAGRVSADHGVPPDLRGAAFGLCWALGEEGDPVRAVRGAAGPRTLGDWLAGLFALARDEVLSEPGVMAVLDELVAELGEADFLIALPALRQAFEFFPPREREAIAKGLLERRGSRASGRTLLRAPADPILIAEARALEEKVDRLLAAEGLT